MIRTLKEADVAALTEIYNYYVRTSDATFEHIELTYEQMYKRLFGALKHFPCLVAEINGKVVGYCALHEWRPRFDHVAEVTMYLDPAERNKGLGAEMLSAIIAEAKAIKELNGLIACINAENGASRCLVERFGFKLAGHYKQVGSKFGKLLDDVDYHLIF